MDSGVISFRTPGTAAPAGRPVHDLLHRAKDFMKKPGRAAMSAIAGTLALAATATAGETNAPNALVKSVKENGKEVSKGFDNALAASNARVAQLEQQAKATDDAGKSVAAKKQANRDKAKATLLEKHGQDVSVETLVEKYPANAEFIRSLFIIAPKK